MKSFFIILTLFYFTTVFADTSCEKCDIHKVSTAYNNIENLTFQLVSDFLCTFDSSCHNNVEFSEYSNETLFKVLNKSPTIFFQVVTDGQVNDESILKELESPINDEIGLQQLYEKIKVVSAPKAIKTKYLKALVIAASASGQEIRK